MRKLIKLVSVLLVVAVMTSLLTSCSKVKCYPKTRVPMFEAVVDVDDENIIDVNQEFAVVRDYFNQISEDGRFLVYAYKDVDPDTVQDYAGALIDAGFSQDLSESEYGSMLFLNNSNNTFSMVGIAYGVEGQSDNSVVVMVIEVDGSVNESAFKELLGY